MRVKEKRAFNFERCCFRPVALKIAYMGWPYHGLASQEADLVETVELHLFEALKKIKLVEDMKCCGYSRCGRTDKGVSSTDQTLSLWVRSQLPKDIGAYIYPYAESIGQLAAGKRISSPHKLVTTSNDGEIDYVTKLNQVLPAYIRVLAWAPTTPTFNARFDCTLRTYQYYFHSMGLSLDRMQLACKKLIGTFDFRMFCKVDTSNSCRSMERSIVSASVELLPAGETAFAAPFARCTIAGKSFLWHQVRCIMSVLFHIGQGLEMPSLIDDLLEVSGCESVGRPSYPIASELPLVLMDCEYADTKLDWQYPSHCTLRRTIQPLYNIYIQHTIQSLLLKQLLEHSVTCMPDFKKEDLIYGIPGFGAVCGPSAVEKYVPLIKRPRCSTLEEKQQKKVKKLR